MSQIRTYIESDRQKLLEIFRMNTPKYFDPIEIKDYESYLDENAEQYLTILIDERIVGGAGYNVVREDHSGRITWIFFDPEFSGLGLGKKTVEYCLSLLETNPIVWKYIVTTSQHAYQFFEKFGFRILRIEKDYWGAGLDLYEMEMAKQITNE